MWLFKISLPFICLFTCDYKILSVICLYMWLVDIFCHVCLYVTVKNIVLHILAKRQCLSCVCLCMTAECVLVFQMFVYVCFAKHVVPFIFLFIYVTLSRVTCVHTSFYVCLQNMSSLMCLFVCLYMFVGLYMFGSQTRGKRKWKYNLTLCHSPDLSTDCDVNTCIYIFFN